MKERPILFSAPMVRAILAGTKTQTRRVLKQATGPSLSVGIDDDEPGVAELSWLWGDGPGHDVHETIKRVPCPYGQPGDRLWVRETWNTFDGWAGYFYAADDHTWGIGESDDPDHVPEHAIRWRPSIHMPRAASRITLEITSVRVERLQEISEADAQAEGAPCELGELERLILGAKAKHRSGFVRLWQSISGPESWDANPWVWVVEFRRVTQ